MGGGGQEGHTHRRRLSAVVGKVVVAGEGGRARMAKSGALYWQVTTCGLAHRSASSSLSKLFVAARPPPSQTVVLSTVMDGLFLARTNLAGHSVSACDVWCKPPVFVQLVGLRVVRPLGIGCQWFSASPPEVRHSVANALRADCVVARPVDKARRAGDNP